jgi:hypothetical protein
MGAEAGASAENCVPKLELGNEQQEQRRLKPAATRLPDLELGTRNLEL